MVRYDISILGNETLRAVRPPEKWVVCREFVGSVLQTA